MELNHLLLVSLVHTIARGFMRSPGGLFGFACCLRSKHATRVVPVFLTEQLRQMEAKPCQTRTRTKRAVGF